MNTARQFIPLVKENSVIILDELEFAFPEEQLSEIEFLHNNGYKISQIAKKVKRDEYETLLAVVHLHRERRLIKPFRGI